MNICDAVKARTTNKPYITRQSWNYPTSVWCNAVVKILPTDTPDCCTIESVASNAPCRGWHLEPITNFLDESIALF